MDSHERFVSLLIRHQPDLRAFVGSAVWDRHLCEDLAQEVALVLWRKFDTFDESRSFGAWARGVAVNLIRQRLADRSRGGLALTDEALEVLSRVYEETPAFGPEKQDALRACLGQLAPEARRIVSLRYEESLSLEAMAQTLNKSFEAVHMLLSRIRAKLLECMKHRLATVER